MSEAEFLQLVKENQNIIYKLVLLYANDDEEKKDLYQEVLLQAWKSWAGFKRESKFSTWLYRVCLNTILTVQRKKKIITYREELNEGLASVQPSSVISEDAQMLRAAIRRMAETDRAIISLHLDGYNNDEISAIVGITTNNAAVKLHRIKQQLATILNKQ